MIVKPVLFLLAGSLPLCAANEWIRITSPNFEMYSNAAVKDARKTIEYFEQVRDFFMRTKSAEVTTRLPVTIVGFRGAKDYKPYAANEAAAAYYLGDENRDFIVMGSVGEETFPVATHEYMHLLIRHMEMKLPVWLNEGIAEVYSSLKPRGGKILIGSVIEGRAYSLGRDKWLPLPKLLSIAHDSPEYNEKNRAGILYAQSWLMAHMLMLSPTYAAGAAKFLEAVDQTQSSEKAFQIAYGKTLADVNKDLQAYYRSNSIRVSVSDAKLEKMQALDSQPATDIQVGVVLAKLTAMLRRYEEAESSLKELALKSPENFEIQEALGHLYWRKRDNARAREHLGRAVELKSTSWKTYWDYARLAQDSPVNDKLMITALDKAIEMNPSLIDARMMLAYRHYSEKRYGQALVALRGVKGISAEMAPRYFLLMAHVTVNLKENAEAKKAALQAKKYAKDGRDSIEADSLLAFLNRPVREAEAAASSRRPTARTADEAPVLRRQERPATTWNLPPSEAEEQLASFEGILTEIACQGEQAKLYIAAGNKSVTFLINDPARVFIKGAKPDEQLLTCGKTRRSITIQYLPKDDRATGTAGEARVIDYGAAQ
jgi:tetratricopeptide (TPR) repeat protein